MKVESYDRTALRLENGTKVWFIRPQHRSLHGITINLFYADSMAFCPPRDLRLMWQSIYPVLAASRLVQVILTSVPQHTHHIDDVNGAAEPNMFYTVYKGAVDGDNDFDPVSVNWDDVPRIDDYKERIESSHTERGVQNALFNQFTFNSNRGLDINMVTA
jgi:hypothetical protein